MLEANFFASSPHLLAHLFKFIQISEEMSLMDTLHESLATFSLSKLCQCNCSNCRNCRNCGQAAECSEVSMAPGPSRSRPTTCSEIHEIHGKVGMRNMRNECLRYLRSPDQEIAVVRLSPILMQKALAPEELETRTFTLSTFPAHTTVQIIERRKKVESTNLHSSWYKLKCLFPMFTS